MVENIDCLICHDQSGTYKKFPTGCGNPAYTQKEFGGKVFPPVDLNLAAKSVGKPNLRNCGICHFYGGGGDGVKHGDLDSSLLEADRKLDVHMAKDGAGYSCTVCHTTVNHEIAGRYYTIRAPLKHDVAMPDKCGNCISCESCHGVAPHKKTAKLNDHTDKVACQTCHVPSFARGGVSTLMWWDWSTAGQFAGKGKMKVVKDAEGRPTYDTKKGDMRWAKDVRPVYAWYNGGMDYVTLDTTLSHQRPAKLNWPLGDYDDPQARIFPFKLYKGRQVYDPRTDRLIIPKLFGPRGTGSFWTEFDWEKAVKAGMAEAGESYSGEIDFLETEMYWPITHMVAPKEDALTCSACHARDGHMANLTGFYLPGRDYFGWLDGLGWFAVLMSLVGVLIHGGGRIVARRLKEKRDEN